MAAGQVALSVIIGGAIGASFGKAIADSTAKLGFFKKATAGIAAEQTRLAAAMNSRDMKVDSLGRMRKETANVGKAFHESTQKIKDLSQKIKEAQNRSLNPMNKKEAIALNTELKRLGAELGRATDKSKRLEAEFQKKRSETVKLKNELKSTKEEYLKLGDAMKAAELKAKGYARINQGAGQVAGAVTLGTAVATTAAPFVMASADYQSIIRDIAIKGGIARTGKEDALSESIRRDATDTGMNRNELAEAVNTLVAGGMDVDGAAAQARAMAKFSVGQNANSTDTAKLVLALRQAGVSDPAAIEKMLGKIAVAGDLGSFEAKDMAKHFAGLLPQLTAFGLSGEAATVALANMLQTQMKAAGSADEAAMNMANLLSKLTSNDSKEKFAKQGIDLQGSMQAAIAQGYDPVSAFIELIQEAQKQEDPAQAEKMAELQERIAKAQNPEDAQKMLDGYLEMAGIAEFVSDKQAKQAVLAAIQNKKLNEENLKLIKSTDGTVKVEKDLADRRASSKKIWQEVGQTFDELKTRIGDAIAPITDLAGDGLIKVGQGLSWVAKEAPILSQAILMLGAAMTATLAAKGVKNVAGGALNIWRAGKTAGGLASQGGGLLSRIGGGLGNALSRVPILGKLAGKIPGAAGKALGAVSAATAQPVFITNWPAGGIGGGLGRPGGTAGATEAAGKKGIMGRARGLLNGSAGKVPVIGGALSAGVGASAAATAAGVVAAGAAGAAIGTYIANPLIDKAVTKISGEENSLGTWIYNLTHKDDPDPTAPTVFTPEQQARIDAAKAARAAAQADTPAPAQVLPKTPPVVNTLAPVATTVAPVIQALTPAAAPVKDKTTPIQAPAPLPKAPAPAANAPAAPPSPPATPKLAPAPPSIAFSPSINLTVNGDVKDPRRMAEELLPHLKRLLDQFAEKAARGDLFDPAHA